MHQATTSTHTTTAATETLLAAGESFTPHRYRLTVADYHRLAALGIFNEDSRIELIEGDLIVMAPIDSQHAGHLDRIAQPIFRQTTQSIVRIQSPIRLSDYSEPEPDLTILRYRADFYTNAHPTPADVLLIIEIADSTLRYDRDIKIPLYAKAGIPEVWLLNLADRQVAVYRHPSTGGYRQIQFPVPEERFSPALLPELVLKAADLFYPPDWNDE